MLPKGAQTTVQVFGATRIVVAVVTESGTQIAHAERVTDVQIEVQVRRQLRGTSEPLPRSRPVVELPPRHPVVLRGVGVNHV
ncbi:hypothetical protein EB73_09640 [Mycobacterium sp. SWH-M3]|nr:hypothetical protein EB73_09640 [Mycobacterium sp. SWH-M3]